MKSRLFKLVSVLLVVFVIMSSGAGCSKQESSDSSQISGTTTEGQADTTVPTEPYDSDTYPIQTDVTLTAWRVVSSSFSKYYNDMAETEAEKIRVESTGIKVDYVHPNNDEALLIMIAGGDLPDIIYMSGWSSYPGGMAKACNDGVILPVNDVKQYVPNYFSILEEYPILDKMIKSSDGYYYGFGELRTEYISEYGPLVREDWLEKVGLDMPETVDEWREMLLAFKEQLDSSAPFTISYPGELFDGARFLVSAFDVSNDFYVDDGKVFYGPIESGFKDYLTTLAGWFKEGLIDEDFTSLNRDVCNTKMINGESGATANWLAYVTLYNDEGRKVNPDFNLAPAPVIVLNKGETAMMGYGKSLYESGSWEAAITKTSKNKELAARRLDWEYTDEGCMLGSFGVKDITYTISPDGAIKLTDYVLNNPDGFEIAQVTSDYCGTSGPGLVHPQKITASIPDKYYDSYVKGYSMWAKTDALNHMLPQISLPSELQSEIDTIMNDIRNYREEMCFRFLIGDLDISSNFEQFVNQIKKIGIDKVLENYQKAYDEYLLK